MVLTPQLLQAIKLLQMPSGELSAFIETELERNPLLERAEERHEPRSSARSRSAERASARRLGVRNHARRGRRALPRDLGTEVDNAFDADRAGDRQPSARRRPTGPALIGGPMAGASAAAAATRTPPTSKPMSPRQESFSEFLTRQAMVALARSRRPPDRRRADRRARRGRLFPRRSRRNRRATRRAARARRAGAGGVLQTLEPTGVFARDLAECLKLQLIERDRFDPAMAGARSPTCRCSPSATSPALRRLCGVDDEDLADMIAEIKRLDPKPGRAFAGAPEPLAIPDVIVAAAPEFGLARRAQRRGAAARAGQRILRGGHQTRRRRARRTGNTSPRNCRARIG